ncbi:hypothetical protein NHH82_21030 [Oxalobacteraceae bacterium OTU3REALA1]|nr:hypothetical protein NHH82_21030 [Oxalobacteraceae bacterium OTU3REALA1]
MSTADHGRRQAALTLHAMTAADRRWLLSQLEAAQRAPLETLLAELAELGIPADPALLQQALRDGGTPAGVHGAPDADAERALRQADPARLAQLLQHEPDRLVARLLLAADWPWQADMLAHCDVRQRQRVVASLHQLRLNGAAPAPRLRAALIDTVSRRLAAAPAPAGMAPAGAARAGGHWFRGAST